VHSKNAAGYVQETNVGTVSATISVPTFDCSDAPPAAAELAVGIGVSNTDDFGDDISYSLNCAASSSSFVVEFDSGTIHTQPFSAAPGDSIAMSIVDNTDSGNYTLSATDVTSGATYTVTEGDDTGNSNAQLFLSSFGGYVPSFSPVTFTNAQVDGQNLSSGSAMKYVLYHKKNLAVTCSKIKTGASFKLTREHS
jgi:hypothetical protein